MDNSVKLIIEIPKEDYKKLVNPYQHNEIWCERLKRMVIHGTPLDDVKAEIDQAYEDVTMYSCDEQVSCFASRVFEILDNIGKESKRK